MDQLWKFKTLFLRTPVPQISCGTPPNIKSPNSHLIIFCIKTRQGSPLDDRSSLSPPAYKSTYLTTLTLVVEIHGLKQLHWLFTELVPKPIHLCVYMCLWHTLETTLHNGLETSGIVYLVLQITWLRKFTHLILTGDFTISQVGEISL